MDKISRFGQQQIITTVFFDDDDDDDATKIWQCKTENTQIWWRESVYPKKIIKEKRNTIEIETYEEKPNIVVVVAFLLSFFSEKKDSNTIVWPWWWWWCGHHNNHNVRVYNDCYDHGGKCLNFFSVTNNDE